MRSIHLAVLVAVLGLTACGPTTTPAAPKPATAVPAGQLVPHDATTTAPDYPNPGPNPAGGASTYPNPGSTQAPVPGVDMMSYTNDKVGFSIRYPLVWQTTDEGTNPVVFRVPGTVGTTLVDKVFQILTTDKASSCKETLYSSATGNSAPTHVTINDIDFLKETGSDVGAGNIHDWTSYSVMKGTTCINVTFVLNSVAAGVYSTEPAPFDKTVETQIFDEVINTFQFN